MNIGAFSLITYIEESSNQEMTLENISGFGYQKPLLAGVFTIFLFSLAGIPPTAGFIGKIYIFGSLISQKQYLYASLGIINSIISLYYYLKIIIFLYRREEKHTISVSPSLPQGVNWIVLSLAIVIFGIIPNTLINIIELAIKSLSNF
jgi:NADH-quinone oxidoreductase subunit N